MSKTDKIFVVIAVVLFGWLFYTLAVHPANGQSIMLPISGSVSHAGGGGITYINSASAALLFPGTISPVNCSGANFYVAVNSWNTGGTPLVQYGAGPTAMTKLSSQSTSWSGNFDVAIYDAQGVTGSGSESFDIGTGSSFYNNFYVSCFSGVKTSGALSNQATSSASCSSPCSAGSVTYVNGDLIIVSLVEDYTATDPTISDSFTIMQIVKDTNTNSSGAMAYKIMSGSGTINPQWTTANHGAATIAVYNKQ